MDTRRRNSGPPSGESLSYSTSFTTAHKPWDLHSVNKIVEYFLPSTFRREVKLIIERTTNNFQVKKPDEVLTKTLLLWKIKNSCYGGLSILLISLLFLVRVFSHDFWTSDIFQVCGLDTFFKSSIFTFFWFTTFLFCTKYSSVVPGRSYLDTHLRTRFTAGGILSLFTVVLVFI
jgi:hypothetical protein